MKPNLQKHIYLSETAWPQVKEYLRLRLRQLCPGETTECLQEIKASGLTYDPVDSHADLFCCRLGGRILHGKPAGSEYPHNVGFCGVQLGSYFIHNLPFTDPSVRAEARRLGLEEIQVKQGYTKCNLVVVNSGIAIGDGLDPGPDRPAAITADRGLAKALAPCAVDLLLIEGGHVELPGFSYGFLGGASGSLGNEILFNGDLRLHPNFEEICRFIREKGKTPRWFSGLPLRDIGSIITLL